MAEAKKFAVFDIDGTLIRWQLYHAIADAVVKLGFAAPGTYDSVKAARMAWKRREAGAHFKDYEAELIHVYEQVLKTLSVEQFEQALAVVFDEYKDQAYTYTRDLIAELKQKKYLIFAISGSQTEIVEMIATHYGFDDYIGTIYEKTGQGFSGHKTVGSHNKSAALNGLVKKHKATFNESVAVGDSASDASMLGLVEKPIAFNPDQDLYIIARKHGWRVVLERKNMIYELESTYGKYQLVKTNAD